MGRRATDGGLTQKEAKFCRKYYECGSATEAYRYAYNCGNMKPATVSNSAYKLLQKPHIAAKIKYYNDNIEEALGLSRQKVLGIIRDIAYDKNATNRERLKALEGIREMLGYDEPKKVRSEVEVKGITVTVESQEQKDKLDDICSMGV